MRERDSQKRKFDISYQEFLAERPVWANIEKDDLYSVVGNIIATKWFKENSFKQPNVTAVVDNINKTCYQGKVDKLHVLRILAWHSIPDHCAFHSREFCKLFLYLIYWFDTVANFKVLRRKLARHRVRYRTRHIQSPKHPVPQEAVEKLNEHRKDKGMKLIRIKKERKQLPEVKNALSLIRKLLPD
mgnify:FL=1